MNDVVEMLQSVVGDVGIVGRLQTVVGSLDGVVVVGRL